MGTGLVAVIVLDKAVADLDKMETELVAVTIPDKVPLGLELMLVVTDLDKVEMVLEA